MSESQQTLSFQQALELAVEHHTAGRLSDAESIYRQLLQADPNQPTALHLLGVIAHQTGKNDEAFDLITKALTFQPDYPDAHSNLGLILQELGKLEEAEASYRKAIEFKPDYAEAHNNLGNTLRQRDQLQEAEASYQKAIELKPDYAEPHNNLGAILHSLGKLTEASTNYQRALTIRPDYAQAHYNLANIRKNLGEFDKAVAGYRKALDLKPDYAEALNNLGTVLQHLGRHEEAVASYRKTLDLKPDYAEAHSNLGNALWRLNEMKEALAAYREALTLNPDLPETQNNLGTALQGLGEPEEALQCHLKAVALSPANDLFWANLGSCLETASFTSADEKFFQSLLHLIDRPNVRPANLTRPIISALRCHPNFSPIVEAVISNQKDGKIPYRDFAKQLSTIPLFLRILELNPIFDLEIEQMLTVLRRAMLEDTMETETGVEALSFSIALAHNSFTNEYVFTETEEEKEAVEKLEQRIVALVEKGQDVPSSFIIALGAYRPLFDFPWAPNLSEQEWKDSVKSVITRQITEPLEERSLRNQIPRITPIQDTTSQSVRMQYEENPYPRWTKKVALIESKSLISVLKSFPLSFDLRDYTTPERPDILVAGCGTGMHPLTTGSRFSNAQVLAVDLSLSSLAYAQRKTTQLGFSNIEYVQGDILELSNLERRFDLIECTGVLHHLRDPLAGWQVLFDLLHPGGLMKIGLYSKVARQHITRGRSLITERGYTTSPADIRQCRQDIISLAADGNPEMTKISDRNDFFSMSECRDLLFHVQEHQFTLPQIEKDLDSLKLKFLGFEIKNHAVRKKFRDSHSSSSALTSLSLWHEFELNNPDTFISMYQFWCQKL